MKKIIYGSLTSDKCSNYARKLLHTLNTFVKEIYEDNSYLKSKEIFETNKEHSLYQKPKSIRRFKDIPDDFCSREGLVFLTYHVAF